MCPHIWVSVKIRGGDVTEKQQEVPPHRQPGLGKASPPTCRGGKDAQAAVPRVDGGKQKDHKPQLLPLLGNQGSQPLAGMKNSWGETEVGEVAISKRRKASLARTHRRVIELLAGWWGRLKFEIISKWNPSVQCVLFLQLHLAAWEQK